MKLKSNPADLVKSLSWIALIAYLILYVVRMIPWLVTNLPNDMHEFSTVNVVYQILDGINPYKWDTFIDSAYVYGITMPALGAFLYKMIGFGMDLTIFLRLLSLVFILASSALVAKEIYSQNKNKFAATLGFTLTLVIGWWTSPIIVTTNSMGVFLMLFTFFILRRQNKFWSVILIAILSLLCFYTKPYFLFVFGIVSLWYFLTSYKNLIIYLATFFSLGALSVFIINHYFPLYFYISVFTHKAISGFGWNHTIIEWMTFSLFYFPLFFIVLLGAIDYLKNNKISPFKRYSINDELFYLIYILCASVVLIKLGGHWGAHLTYFYHLLLPILTIYGLIHLDLVQNKIIKPIIYGSLLFFSVYHIAFISSLPKYRAIEANKAIEKVDHWMSSYKENEMLVLTQYAGPYTRKHGFAKHYSSHLWQFTLAKNKTINNKPSSLFKQQNEFNNKMLDYENNLLANIKDEKYQMIITTGGIPEVKGSDSIIEQHYDLKETIQIPAGRLSYSTVYVYTLK